VPGALIYELKEPVTHRPDPALGASSKKSLCKCEE